MENPDLLLPLLLARQQSDSDWFETEIIAKKRKDIQKLMVNHMEQWRLDGKHTLREQQAAERDSDCDSDVIILGD